MKTHQPSRSEISEVIRELWDWRGYWVVGSPDTTEHVWFVGCPVDLICGVESPFVEELTVVEQTSPKEWDEQVAKIAEARPTWTKAQLAEKGGRKGKFFRVKKLKDCPDFVVEEYRKYTAYAEISAEISG